MQLPYKLQLKPLGYEIHDSSQVRFPLYLLTEAPTPQKKLDLKKSKGEEAGLATKVKLKTLHLIRFEQAIVLLDQNI